MPDPEFDHEQAIEACARQDEQALQRLYREESPRMLSLLIRMLGQREQAEDCLHDAFVQIWQNAGRYRRELGSGRAWLYSIVRYRALNELRRRGHRSGCDALNRSALSRVLARQRYPWRRRTLKPVSLV